jgi:hypothetical protein
VFFGPTVDYRVEEGKPPELGSAIHGYHLLSFGVSVSASLGASTGLDANIRHVIHVPSLGKLHADCKESCGCSRN